MVNPLTKMRFKGPPVSATERIFDGVMVVFCVFFSFLMVYPVLYILKQSFSSANTVGVANLSLLPLEWSLDGYRYILRQKSIWIGFRNTFLRVGLSTGLGILLAIGYAYPLSKKDLPFRRMLTYLIVVTMFVSGGLIPRYILISKTLSLTNTIWSMVLPNLAKAFNIVMMRNFFMCLPSDLSEAAEIDGCGQLQTLLQIILPISKPILATVSMWIIVENWNAWFDCMLYITDPNGFVIQLVLRKIIFTLSSEVVSVGEMRESSIAQDVVKYCTIIVATVPVLAIYPFIQKYFVKGIMVGSLKG